MPSHLIRDLVGMGPIGIVLLVLPPLALAASVVALSSRGPVGRVAAITALCISAVAAFGAGAAVHASRTEFLGAVVGADGHAFWPSLSLFRGLVAELVGALTALGLIPLVAAAIAVQSIRARPDLRARALACLATAAVALPAWITAFAIFETDQAMLSTRTSEYDPRGHYEALMGCGALLDEARPLLIALGTALAIAMAALGIAQRGIASTRARVACLAIGAVGVAAYAATRGEAEDAAHPVPYEDAPLFPGTTADELPVVTGACVPVDGVLVSVTRWGTTQVDGTTTDHVRAMLEARRAEWPLVHPARAFPGVVVVAAPADTAAREPLRYVAMAREAGYTGEAAAVAMPVAPVRSRTLGVLTRPTRTCAVSLAGDTAGPEPWGEFLRRETSRMERPK